MKYGIYFNTYENEIYIYKIYDDESRVKILRFYEKNNNIHLDIRANNFKHFIGFNELTKLMEMDMTGVDMRALYDDLLAAGVQSVYE